MIHTCGPVPKLESDIECNGRTRKLLCGHHFAEGL